MNQEIEADVVVIGSGIAGALTAFHLAKAGVKKVVVAEAGPRIRREEIVRNFQSATQFSMTAGYPDPAWAPRPRLEGSVAADGSKYSYIEDTGPFKSRVEYVRAVGGTTWHWTAHTPRFLPVDFRLRSAHGVGADWPVDYKVMEPFYCAAEGEMAVSGDSGYDGGSPRSRPYPLPPTPLSYWDNVVKEGLRGIDMPVHPIPAARATKALANRPQCMGFGTCNPICPSGAKYSAIEHVEKAEKLGVRFLENTRVDRLDADDNGVRSAEARRPDNSKVILRGKIFVLAANGIETPRLLLMSVSDKFPKGLANSSGLVGRYFMNHTAIICTFLMPKPVYSGRGPTSVAGSYAFRDGPFRSKRPAWAVSIENYVHFHDITDRLLQQGVKPPKLDATLREHFFHEAAISIIMEQLPDPQNGLTLDWSARDTAGQPRMKLRCGMSAYEEAGFNDARETFKKMAGALRAEIASTTDPIGIHHPIGMTRMGDDPRLSVTDGFGRCHDHRNLFVAGSSLFPTTGTANPTLTIAALALRTAPEILRQLHAG